MEVAAATERDVAPVHELMVQWEREGVTMGVRRVPARLSQRVWRRRGTTIGYTACDEANLRGFLSECCVGFSFL